MWELDYKESWMLKNWCFRTVVLEKTLESPLDCKETLLVCPKGDQSWIFIGRTDVEAETPILWPPDAKNWLIGKDPDAGKTQRWEKGTTEDGMVGWHHWLNGHEFEWTPWVGDGQRGLVCCSPWDCKESDTTERLNWADRYLYHWGFPGDASGKEHACQCRRHKRHGFNPWVGKIPWRRHGNPLQYSCLGNTINRGAWQATVHSVAESQTQLKQFTMHASLII